MPTDQLTYKKSAKKAPSFRELRPASEAASQSKRANRKTDSRHEILLRRELTKLGLRYRKYVGDLPGNPDVVFRTAKVVVFCDGDFWHGRDWVWNAPDFCTRGYESMGWVNETAVCCWSKG